MKLPFADRCAFFSTTAHQRLSNLSLRTTPFIKRKTIGWDTLSNGERLKAAEEAGFHVLLTTDKNIRFQQNLSKLSIAIVVLGNPTWPTLSEYVKRVIEAVISAKPDTYCEVDIPER